MLVGASTANLYPMLLERSLETLLSTGFRTLEVFINSPSELDTAYVKRLRYQLDAAGASACSLHPFSSFQESFFLFSAYGRRVADYLEEARHQFQAAALLGAPYLVLHGCKLNSTLSVPECLERYERLYDLGKTFGVRVAQENVVLFRSGDPAYLREMRRFLGDKAHFVLDLKQARRCGLTADEVMEAMGDRIVHVHLSDGTADCDCLPPGTGSFDFVHLFHELNRRAYTGVSVIELYRSDFDTSADLWKAANYLNSCSFM